MHYFVPWDNSDAALSKYLDKRDDLHSGRKPRVKTDGLTVRELLNRFMPAKQRLLDPKEIAPRSFDGYHETCRWVGEKFGLSRLATDLTAEDFEELRCEFSRDRSPNSMAGDVQRVRTLFKWGYESGLLDRPVRFGPGFKKPSKKVLREARHAKGPRMFEPVQTHALLSLASPQLKAMFLLGVNCGFGNAERAGRCVAQTQLLRLGEAQAEQRAAVLGGAGVAVGGGDQPKDTVEEADDLGVAAGEHSLL